MACPHVAGLAAVIMRSNVIASPRTATDIQDYIKRTAVAMKSYSAKMIVTTLP